MMDKKAIILIIVLVIALGFLGFSVYFYMTRSSQVVDVRPEAPGGAEAGGSNGVKPVEEVRLEGWEEVMFQARINQDPSMCGLITDALAKGECEDGVNILIASSKNDINLCRSISSSQTRDTCYRTLGTRNGINFCEYLTIRENREACQEANFIDSIVATGDVNDCFELSGSDIDKCVTQFIRKFKLSQECNQINDEEYVEICKGAF